MRIRTKLDRLEKAAHQHYEVLRLPDGTQVRYTSEDLLEALSAAIAQEGHWLLPAIRRAGTNCSGLASLVGALQSSWERVRQEGEALEE